MIFRRIYAGILLLLAALLAGCGQAVAPTAQRGAPTPAAAPQGAPTAAAAAANEVTPVYAFSEAVAGPNRLALGLLRNNTPVNDPGAKVHLRFFKLDAGNSNPQLKSEADATYYGQGLPAAVWVAYATFDAPGNWGVEVQTRLSGQAQPSVSRLQLEVKAKSSVPNVGEPAIPVKTTTVKDVTDPSQLSSDTQPDLAIYQISLDEALKNGKPTAVLFATPGFCETATCGPSVEVMKGFQKTYGDKVNIIHVEVYKYPFGESAQRQVFAEPMAAWRLTTEPWLFLIDGKGTIAARFEGGITKEEIGPALEKLAAGQPLVVGP